MGPFVLLLVIGGGCHEGPRPEAPTAGDERGDTQPEETGPPAVPRPGATFAAGGAHVCLVRDGHVHCWGRNDHGQVGDGRRALTVARAIEVTGIEDAIAVGLGELHSCAVRATGAVACWGENRYGQLGDGTTERRTSPVPVAGVDNAVAVTAGERHTCALRRDATVLCWGSGEHGRLGAPVDVVSPSPVVVRLRDAVQIDAGRSSTCAVRATGRIACWGANHHHQLGGDAAHHRAPIEVTGIDDAVQVAVAWLHACAVRSDGRIACWGSNAGGALGAAVDVAREPVAVTGLDALGPATAVAARGMFTCALLRDGATACWGANARGQLGDGTLTSRPTPAVIPRLEAEALVAGHESACALHAGEVRCWGATLHGRLGHGEDVDRPHPTPVAVLGLP